jgi:hypothetical protein
MQMTLLFFLLMFVNELSIEFLKSYIKLLKLNIIEMIENKLIPDEDSDLPIVYKDLDEENLPNRLLSNFCE